MAESASRNGLRAAETAFKAETAGEHRPCVQIYNMQNGTYSACESNLWLVSLPASPDRCERDDADEDRSYSGQR
jgi:hypothetical protein